MPATSAAWVLAHEDTGSDTSLPESPRQVPGGKTTAWSASATFPVEEKRAPVTPGACRPQRTVRSPLPHAAAVGLRAPTL